MSIDKNIRVLKFWKKGNLTTHKIINDRVDGAVEIDEESRGPVHTDSSWGILMQTI